MPKPNPSNPMGFFVRSELELILGVGFGTELLRILRDRRADASEAITLLETEIEEAVEFAFERALKQIGPLDEELIRDAFEAAMDEVNKAD